MLPVQVYGAVRATPHSWIGSRGPVKSPGLAGWTMVPIFGLTPPPPTWQVPHDSPGRPNAVEKNSTRPLAASSAWDACAPAAGTASSIWVTRALGTPGSPCGSATLETGDARCEHAAATVATATVAQHPRIPSLLI